MSNKDSSKSPVIKKEAVEDVVAAGDVKGEKRPISDDEGNQYFKKRQREPSYYEDKPVIEKGVTGRVKWYNIRFRYGFISRDDNPQNDVYVHQTAITKSRMIKYYLRTLANGEEVLFDIIEGNRGREAANVTGPDGKEVRGHRFNNMQQHSAGRRYAYSRDLRRTGSPHGGNRSNDAQVEGNPKSDAGQLHPEGNQQKEEKGLRRRIPRSYRQRQYKQQSRNDEDGKDDAQEEKNKQADIDSRLDDNKKRFRRRRRFQGGLRQQRIYKPNSANEEHVVKNISTNPKKVVSGGGEEDEEIADIVNEVIETLVLDL